MLETTYQDTSFFSFDLKEDTVVNALLKITHKGPEFNGSFFFTSAQKSDIVTLFAYIQNSICAPINPQKVHNHTFVVLALHWSKHISYSCSEFLYSLMLNIS